MIRQIHIRFSRYFPGYEIDGDVLLIELGENSNAFDDLQVLRDVPWAGIVFEDGFEVQMEKSAMTMDADARYEATYQFICDQTHGLRNKRF